MTIRRKAAFLAAAVGMIIILDGQAVGRLGNNAFIELEVPFGRHVLDVRPEYGWSSIGGNISFEVEPNKILTVDVSFGIGGANFKFSTT